jgi:hypothetical protein
VNFDEFASKSYSFAGDPVVHAGAARDLLQIEGLRDVTD